MIYTQGLADPQWWHRGRDSRGSIVDDRSMRGKGGEGNLPMIAVFYRTQRKKDLRVVRDRVLKETVETLD